MIDIPDVLVDSPVLDRGLVGQARVGIEDRLDTVSQAVLDLFRDQSQTGSNLEQVRFQPLVVEAQAHSTSVYGAYPRSRIRHWPSAERIQSM